jgi:hypothetical protein
MQKFFGARIVLGLLLSEGLIFAVSCEQRTTDSNVVPVNSNANSSINTNLNSNVNSAINANTLSTNSTSTITEAKEPNQYQAKVTMKFQATGNLLQTASQRYCDYARAVNPESARQPDSDFADQTTRSQPAMHRFPRQSKRQCPISAFGNQGKLFVSLSDLTA